MVVFILHFTELRPCPKGCIQIRKSHPTFDAQTSLSTAFTPAVAGVTLYRLKICPCGCITQEALKFHREHFLMKNKPISQQFLEIREKVCQIGTEIWLFIATKHGNCEYSRRDICNSTKNWPQSFSGTFKQRQPIDIEL